MTAREDLPGYLELTRDIPSSYAVDRAYNAEAVESTLTIGSIRALAAERDLCANCLREAMDAELGADAVKLTDEDARVVRDVINEFCDLHGSFYGLATLDNHLISRLWAQFGDNAYAVVELIEILAFG